MSSLDLGYATASTEGRIAVEYFDPSPEAQEKKYAFKCHRQTIDDVDHVWPVNALAFHPVYNTFASAGSDGTVSIWDHKVKKRLRQYQKYKTAIPSIGFNCDGTRLAVGVSYTWDEGEEGTKSAERPAVYVKKVGDEVKVSFSFALVESYRLLMLLLSHSRKDGRADCRSFWVIPMRCNCIAIVLIGAKVRILLFLNLIYDTVVRVKRPGLGVTENAGGVDSHDIRYGRARGAGTRTFHVFLAF